jgi:hypothetical protein
MDKTSYSELENILRKIEFPGEDDLEILTFQNKREMVSEVMKRVNRRILLVRKTVFWIVFTILNLFVLFLFGTDRSILQNILVGDYVLSSFYYLFLGLAFVGGLIGLIFNIDTSWVNDVNPHAISVFISKNLDRFMKK